MSSRQEEKERRRQERLEREAAEQRAAASRRRIQLVGGVALAIAALAAIAFAGFTALSGGDDGPSTARSDTARAAAAKLPAQKETDVNVAAKTAGCDLVHPKYEGAGHEDRDFTPADYKTNPPTSGTHNPVVAEDGIYEPGNEPKLGNLVHTLEHGRIDIQYRPGTSAALISQLEGFVAENEGYHMVMFQNQTKMPFEVAATAWTHLLGCEKMNPQVWDALRTFRDAYIDKGPEKVP